MLIRWLTQNSIISESGFAESVPQSSGELKQEKLDSEELKIQREADYMADVIKQRQEDLDNVETLMNDVNSIAKQINVKVHEQREDLEAINANADTALDNAEKAHENIESAQKHQKKGGKVMYFILGGISILVLIILIVLGLKIWYESSKN